MQWATAIFVDLNAPFQKIVIEQLGADFDDWHIRLALYDELHSYAPAGRVFHCMQQAVAGKEIGIGDNHFALRIGEHFQVVAFNVITVIVIVAPDKQRLSFTGRAVILRLVATSLPPASDRRVFRQIFHFKLQNVSHHRAFNPYGIVLLGFGAVAGDMFSGIINAADKCHRVIDHHDFTVHAAKDIGPQTEQTWTGIVVAEDDASRGERIDEFIAEIRRTIAVEQHFDIHAATGRFE